MSRLLRALWRLGRRTPVLGAVVRLGDRVWWYRAVVGSGLVDAEYYAAQRGWTRASVRRAAFDYTWSGYRRGLSLHPLVDELVLGRGLPEADRVPAVYAYVVSDGGQVRSHAWWDGAGGLDALRAGGDPDIRLRYGAFEWTLPVSEVRRHAVAAARAWRSGSAKVAVPGAPARVTVLRLVGRADARYDEKLVALAPLPSDVERVVVASAPDAGQWVALDLLARGGAGVSAVLGPAGHADAVSSGAVVASGATLVVLGACAAATGDDVLALAAHAAEGHVVAPAQIAPDGTIESVGAARVGGRTTYRLLAGLPREDLERIGTDVIAVPAITGETFAIAAADLVAGGGLDPADGPDALVGLVARLRAASPSASTWVDPRIVVTQYVSSPRALARRRDRGRWAGAESDADRGDAEALLASAGFRVLEWRGTRGDVLPRLARSDGAPERWAIRVSSPAGPAGEVWGDTHFARGLANALRRTGREVVIDAYEARERPTAELDDVTVVVRGPHRIRPPRTGVRLLWIISHPDEITGREVSWFDGVFAASTRWAASASRRFGTEVAPLLECTDTDQFFPRGLERGDEIVFVGTSRGIARPSVVAPLAAGIPVKVYGPDWRGFIPSSAIAARSIPNERLSERYESAAVVLNDHWPAMRREGFMAMRPFDVVAAGGRVVSEDVDGLNEVFGGAVVAYRDEAELVELLSGDLDRLFPDADELARIRERVRREHSFDARVAVLVQTAEAARVGRTRRVQRLN